MDFLADIRERAAKRRARLVFAEGDDARTQDAAARLIREGIARPVLLGRHDELTAALRARDVPADAVSTVDPLSDPRRDAFAEALARLRAHRGMTSEAARQALRQPLLFAAFMVRAGDVDGSVAGAVNTTADVLRAALWAVGPAPGIRTVSSSFYMVVRDFRARGPEVLTFTDAGVVPDPDPAQLADIARAAVVARRRIVGDEPRVAFLSFSTKGSAEDAAVDKVRQGFEHFRTLAPEVPADGELQADAALMPDVGRRKAPDSPVAGTANILVFPDLDAGNIAYKLVQRLAGASAIGPVLQGLDRPCNDLSRGASADDIVHAACITALLA